MGATKAGVEFQKSIKDRNLTEDKNPKLSWRVGIHLDDIIIEGDNIYGKAQEDFSGRAVSLSSDGTRVAIGAPGNDDNGYAMGHVRIYDYDGIQNKMRKNALVVREEPKYS